MPVSTCHWFLGEDFSARLAEEMKVCSRLCPVAGDEVLRLLVNPVGFEKQTWCDPPRMAVRPVDANRIWFLHAGCRPLFRLGPVGQGSHWPILYALVSI